MIRKNNNRNNSNRNHRGGSGGGSGGARRYNNNSSGGNRSNGANDGQNLQRQKHHATQQLGKYSDMARNAQINGDRVDVEYYLQHVDHYTRVLTDIAAVEAERYASQRESQIIPGGPNDPNAQQHHGGDTAGGGSTSGDSGGYNAGNADSNANNDTNAGDGNADFSNNNQPRMTRQPRRQHYSEPQQSGDNGARDANSNTNEIPLPGGILPPI